MSTLLEWLEILVRVGGSIGLVVFCAMRAKRAGGGVWLLASLGVINVLLTLMGRVMSHMELERPLIVFRMLDAGFTVISAMLVFIGCILLR